MDLVQTRPPGRPRDESVGPAVLEVVRRLVIRDGFRAVSMRQIADAAGVAKQTLYRRWPSKAELILDTFLVSVGEVPVAADGPLDEILRTFLIGVFENLETDGPAIRSLIASAQDDPDLLASFRDRFVRPRASIVRDILLAAQRRGELGSAVDLDIATEAFHGAFWYRLLQAEPLDEAFARRLTAFTLAGLKSSG